jgi:hypothetical protein
MAPPQVSRDHVSDRIVTRVDDENGLDAGCHAGTIAIATVKDHVLEHDNRLVQTAGPNVGNQLVELGVLNQRKKVG